MGEDASKAGPVDTRGAITTSGNTLLNTNQPPSMELGSHLAAKLEPFVLMSKSAKGAGAAKLIQDATSAQGVYFFAELLDAPNIKEVGRNEHLRTS
jgi:hypothetical protein